MSGVEASQAGQAAEWCGPERSDYTVAAFRPKGLALTPKGPQAPQNEKQKVSQRLSLDLRARDRHRTAKTGFPPFN